MSQQDTPPSPIEISPGAAMAHGCCGGFRSARIRPAAEIIHVDFHANTSAGNHSAPQSTSESDEIPSV